MWELFQSYLCWKGNMDNFFKKIIILNEGGNQIQSNLWFGLLSRAQTKAV